MPYYSEMIKNKADELPDIFELGTNFNLKLGSNEKTGSILGTTLPGSDVSVILVEQEDYYKRPGLYQFEGRDFSEDFISDSSAIIVNKAGLKAMKLENPIGTELVLGNQKRKLI